MKETRRTRTKFMALGMAGHPKKKRKEKKRQANIRVLNSDFSLSFLETAKVQRQTSFPSHPVVYGNGNLPSQEGTFPILRIIFSGVITPVSWAHIHQWDVYPYGSTHTSISKRVLEMCVSGFQSNPAANGSVYFLVEAYVRDS